VAKDEFFPDSPRVVYDRAPLKQVVCQFRFPAILKIDAEIPSEFQERIRATLPLSERVESFGAHLQLPKQIMAAIAGQAGSGGYKFLTENRATFIEITSSNFTLTTSVYTQWKDFKALLMMSIGAFVGEYKPNFYIRVGLRYVNAIDRKLLNLLEVPWHELLNKSLLGELGDHFIEQNVEEIQKSIRVRNSDKRGGFLIQHGLFKADPDAASSYFIDFDFYVNQKTEIADAAAVLDALHDRSGLAWRWCIEKKLHDALGPHDA
jgi:uncharacterized protein (TIGR04255 family)